MWTELEIDRHFQADKSIDRYKQTEVEWSEQTEIDKKYSEIHRSVLSYLL